MPLCMKIYLENHLEGKGQEPFPKGHSIIGYRVRVIVKRWENYIRAKGNWLGVIFYRHSS